MPSRGQKVIHRTFSFQRGARFKIIYVSAWNQECGSDIIPIMKATRNHKDFQVELHVATFVCSSKKFFRRIGENFQINWIVSYRHSDRFATEVSAQYQAKEYIQAPCFSEIYLSLSLLSFAGWPPPRMAPNMTFSLACKVSWKPPRTLPCWRNS